MKSPWNPQGDHDGSGVQRFGSARTVVPGQAAATQPVKVRSRQGRSGPPGSECCAAVGDGGREAYTAVVWGVGMSHERHNVVGAETVGSVEGNMCGTVTRGADALPGSMATSRTKGSLGDP